jgi:hypothetical protein
MLNLFSLRRNARSLVGCALVCGLLLGMSAQPAQAALTYTFDSLTTGTLHGQDGWADFITAGNNHTVTSVVPSHLGFATNVVTGFDQSARTNDGNYSYAPLSPLDTAAIIQFDVNSMAGGDTAVFALGRDLATIDVGRHSRLGPQFGLFGNAFMIRGAVEGAITTTPLSGTDSSSDWYRMQLVVDFTANGGNGAGSVFLKNLTDGEASVRAIAGLSNINLQILNMEAASEVASTWNSLYLRSSGTQTLFDNLQPSPLPPPPPAPEPSSLLLLGLGALVLAKRGRGRGARV